MSNLIAICFDDEHKAFELKAELIKLQKEYLMQMEDVVVVTKESDGKVKLHQAVNLTAAGAVGGAFWGTLIGLIFLNPLLGAAVGAGAGALSGSVADVGINDDFMKELGQNLKEGNSALFVLVRKSTPDKVLARLEGFGGTVLRTSLSVEEEQQLRQALSGKH